jgi:hypothetical protein
MSEAYWRFLRCILRVMNSKSSFKQESWQSLILDWAITLDYADQQRARKNRNNGSASINEGLKREKTR